MNAMRPPAAHNMPRSELATVVVAITRLAERSGHIEAMDGAIAAAERRRRPFPLIHINRALGLRGLEFRLLDRRAPKSSIRHHHGLNEVRRFLRIVFAVQLVNLGALFLVAFVDEAFEIRFAQVEVRKAQGRIFQGR